VPIIEVRGLAKHYRSDSNVVHAVDGVNLSVEQGEFTVIAGPSGSGKTTLLNLIGALDAPDEGTIVVDGLPIHERRTKDLSRLRLTKIGFVFQAYNLMPVLTALENAEFVLLLRGEPERARRAKVRALFKEVGMEGLEDRFPSQLSGGQQQRVAVVRAVAAEPAIILADEPTANLDTAAALSLLDLLEVLNHEKGVTFLFSSHDQRVIDRAHRIIRLQDGRIVEDVSPGHKEIRLPDGEVIEDRRRKA
jgi:putative ABC transport system ATP-binding protein